MNEVARIWPAQQVALYIAAMIVAVAALFMVLAPQAHAAPLTEAQAQQLTSLLASFGTEPRVIAIVQLVLNRADKEDILRTLDTAHASSTAKEMHPLPPTANACAVFARTLARGASGEDVSRLQNFLHGTGDLDADNATGFFGSSTEAAVKHWQTRIGVIASGTPNTTGFGALGPKTRGAIVANCKGLRELDDTHKPHGTPRTGSSSPTSVLNVTPTDVSEATSAVSGSLVGAVILAPLMLVTDSLGDLFYSLGVY